MNNQELSNLVDSYEWPKDTSLATPAVVDTEWIKRRIDVSTPLGTTNQVVKCKQNSDGSYILFYGEEERIGRLQMGPFLEAVSNGERTLTQPSLHFLLLLLDVKHAELARAMSVGRSTISNFSAGLKSSRQTVTGMVMALMLEMNRPGFIKTRKSA